MNQLNTNFVLLPGFIIFAAIFYWSGLVNGSALAAIFRKEYDVFVARLKYPLATGWILILFIYFSDFATAYSTRLGVDSTQLVGDILFLMPFWTGIIGGISSQYTSNIFTRRTFQFVPALFVFAVGFALLSGLFQSFLVDYHLTGIGAKSLWGIVAFTELSWLLNAAYMLNRVYLSAEEIVTEIPDGVGKQKLREVVSLLQQDGENVTFIPPYKRLRFKTGFFPGRKMDTIALLENDALYLRISAGHRQKNTQFSFKPAPVIVLWVKIDWANIFKVTEDNIMGYRETRISLKKSGLTVALTGISPILSKLPTAVASAPSEPSGVRAL